MRTHHPRSGFSLTELIVCASLLMAVMSFIATLSIRTNRLWQDTRLQKLAIDELSNQLEELTSLDRAGAEKAIADLELSEAIRNSMPQASIDGEIVRINDSTQIVLTLWIDGKDGPTTTRHAPLELVGFLSPANRETTDDQGEET
ncbi:MAG: hypothetical protein AAGG48_00200 [Planctomycetota bacterium]